MNIAFRVDGAPYIDSGHTHYPVIFTKNNT